MPPFKARPKSTRIKASGRAPNCTREEKIVIVAKFDELRCYEAVAEKVGRTTSCVRKIVKKFQATQDYNRMKPSGRPRCTTTTDDHKILLDVLRNRDITSEQLLKTNPQLLCSTKTVRRRITESGEFASYWKTMKPFISDKNRLKRVKWCRAHLHWTPAQWARVLWSDESPFVLRFNRKTRVWRRHNERFKKWATRATVKHDVKIMVWGCFASHGVGNLYRVEGIMNKHQYKEILINQMKPSAQRLFDMDNWHFQQDNDPKHTANTTKTWFTREKTPLMPWPAQSPDLNPIENLWSWLDYNMKDRSPGNAEELFETLQESWNSIPIDLLSKLSDSMPRRCAAVIAANGYATKY